MSTPTRNTGLGILTTLRQMVANLDAQRDQMTEAIERTAPSRIPGIYPDTDRENPDHQRMHRDLVPFFTEIAHAREALVDAHNLLRDVVAPIDMARPSR